MGHSFLAFSAINPASLLINLLLFWMFLPVGWGEEGLPSVSQAGRVPAARWEPLNELPEAEGGVLRTGVRSLLSHPPGRGMIDGLAHLHDLKIIHRDLKPHNVLISSGKSVCAKLSDMGISKRLSDGKFSLTNNATGSGSSGWQAPELLLGKSQTFAVDLFSLGCVLFFCITKGKHPFGKYFERDTNIANNRLDLSMVESIPEAIHLFSQMLQSDPLLRPKAHEVLQHPLFWSSEIRMSFLRDTSDRIELEDKEKQCYLLEAVEQIGPVVFGDNWDTKFDPMFLASIGSHRRYNVRSTRHLLRLIRNKWNHYIEFPKEVQDYLGNMPDGFDDYLTSRFPNLLIEVYKVIYEYCREERYFIKYFKGKIK